MTCPGDRLGSPLPPRELPVRSLAGHEYRSLFLARARRANYVYRVDDLPRGAREALERARAETLSYAVRMLRAPDGRTVAVLGEAHMKLARAAAIGRDVVASFELRGVETFRREQVLLGRTLGVLIHFPRLALRALSFGAVKGSTITEAKQLPSGYTVELERARTMPLGLHVASLYMTAFFAVASLAALSGLLAPIAPGLVAGVAAVAWAFNVHMLMLVPAIVLRRHTWSWVVHPFLGILTLRDHLMAAGTVRMLADHPREKAAVVVMGRAHVSGYARVLVEHHGFATVS